MKKYLFIVLLCVSTGAYAQSISFYDLTNLTNLTDGEAHNYLTLGKIFKHEYVESVDGKKREHFRSINPNAKLQTITIGESTILKDRTVLHTIVYTTQDPQHVVNMISQARRAKMVMKFQGVNNDNNIFIFDNEFYRAEMYISTTENKGLVKINQKEFIGY